MFFISLVGIFLAPKLTRERVCGDERGRGRRARAVDVDVVAVVVVALVLTVERDRRGGVPGHPPVDVVLA